MVTSGTHSCRHSGKGHVCLRCQPARKMLQNNSSIHQGPFFPHCNFEIYQAEDFITVPREGHTALKWQLEAKNASVDFVCALVAVSHEKYSIFIDFECRISALVSQRGATACVGERATMEDREREVRCSGCYIRGNYQRCHLPSHVRPLTRPVESQECCQIAGKCYIFLDLIIATVYTKSLSGTATLFLY